MDRRSPLRSRVHARDRNRHTPGTTGNTSPPRGRPTAAGHELALSVVQLPPHRRRPHLVGRHLRRLDRVELADGGDG